MRPISRTPTKDKASKKWPLGHGYGIAERGGPATETRAGDRQGSPPVGNPSPYTSQEALQLKPQNALASTNNQNQIPKRVYLNFDKDMAHKMFGYRVRFAPEEMITYNGLGQPPTASHNLSERVALGDVDLSNFNSRYDRLYDMYYNGANDD